MMKSLLIYKGKNMCLGTNYNREVTRPVKCCHIVYIYQSQKEVILSRLSCIFICVPQFCSLFKSQEITWELTDAVEKPWLNLTKSFDNSTHSSPTNQPSFFSFLSTNFIVSCLLSDSYCGTHSQNTLYRPEVQMDA